MPFSPDDLRSAREHHGHTQQQAAAHLGVSVSIVAKWETGRRAPKGLYNEKVNTYIAESLGSEFDPDELRNARIMWGQTLGGAADDGHIDLDEWRGWEDGSRTPDSDELTFIRAYIAGAAARQRRENDSKRSG